MSTHNEQPNKGGAPKGNRNATKHGLRASGLPEGCKYLEGQLSSFRRYVREEMTELHGSTSTYQEALLQSAIRHETRALLAARWLRKEGEAELPLADRIQLLKTISDATDSRDKCLKELDINRKPDEADYSVLYGKPPE